ncbi:ATP-binding protein [Streptomyces sp. NPDC058486]|uniref:ATP-binding protein n=1 Tax=unclassified Streptomyces TaxID=2593676 RepID=UPI0036532A91
MLLVTELVADAARRRGVTYELRLDRSVDGVWVQVSDTGPIPPFAEGGHSPGGYSPGGLFLCRRLASDWGWMPRGRGRTVWCEVRFPQEAARSV